MKKGLLTAIGTASIAVQKADKILKEAAKKGLINTKDVRSLVNKLIKEAQREKIRVKQILAEEFKKQARKAKPVVNKGKRAISKVKNKGKRAISSARRKVKKAQRIAEKRGKKAVRKAAKRLR